MSASDPIMTINIRPLPTGIYRVESKVAKCASMKRTVSGTALPHHLASLAELATETHNRRSSGTVESPFNEANHG